MTDESWVATNRVRTSCYWLVCSMHAVNLLSGDSKAAPLPAWLNLKTLNNLITALEIQCLIWPTGPDACGRRRVPGQRLCRRRGALHLRTPLPGAKRQRDDRRPAVDIFEFAAGDKRNRGDANSRAAGDGAGHCVPKP